MSGPLQGLKVIEMEGIGPGPFAAMMLADMGADVVRISRPGTPINTADVLARGRTVVELNLREESAIEHVLTLVAKADILIEGFRPGVMERLGLGPDVCLAKQPKLIYGRMTGWGQHGPLANAAGHDINYIALTGALHGIGNKDEAPIPPLNLVGDFGGGAMFLVTGILAALHELKSSGQGQVIDAAMTDGASLLSAMMYGFKAQGLWANERGHNFVDGAAHFYSTYECADGKYVSIGSIEPKFYELLRQHCAIEDDELFDQQLNTAKWPEMKERLAVIFKQKSRAEWVTLMEGTDVCFAPVLDWNEAPLHHHNVARQTFIELDGVIQPAPAPRFSSSPGRTPKSIKLKSIDSLLHEW
jgi:alpha-methylacyl-CoA racemase